MWKPILGAALLSSLLSGCVSLNQAGENLDQAGENLDQAGRNLEQAGESIREAGEKTEDAGEKIGDAERGAEPTKPPIARMQIFSGKGILIFQSTFVAEDSVVQHVFESGEDLTFIASLSETLEPGATLKGFTWAFGDGTQASGKTVKHAFPSVPEGKIYDSVLTVTDSHDRSDSVKVRVGVYPNEKVVVTQEESGSPFLGVGGTGFQGMSYEDHTFAIISEQEGKILKPRLVVIALVPTAAPTVVNLNIILMTASETVLAATDDPGAADVLEYDARELVPENLTARVTFNTGAWVPAGDMTPAGPTYIIRIETTYQVTTKALEAIVGGEHHA